MRSCKLHLYAGDLPGLQERRTLWSASDHAEIPFSFEALVAQSIAAMQRDDNARGLEALAEAIPAVRPLVDRARPAGAAL